MANRSRLEKKQKSSDSYFLCLIAKAGQCCKYCRRVNKNTCGIYMRTCIHAYMCTCIHAYMYTCMHACIHACIRPYMHTCMHATMHTCMYAAMHPSIHPSIDPSICTCMHACMTLQRSPEPSQECLSRSWMAGAPQGISTSDSIHAFWYLENVFLMKLFPSVDPKNSFYSDTKFCDIKFL